jgi:hypothetical protein
MESLVLSIAGSIILILLGIIGYYIVKDVKKQDKINDKLFNIVDKERESLERLNISITALNGVLLMMQDKSMNFEKRYEQHREACEKHFEKMERIRK